MNKEEMILLNNFLQENLDEKNKDLVKLAKHLDLMVKQVLLQEKYQKEINEISEQINNLK